MYEFEFVFAQYNGFYIFTAQDCTAQFAGIPVGNLPLAALGERRYHPIYSELC